MSINHYSSDQFPEAQFYWPSQYMVMESSSSDQNKSTFFSHLISNNTNTTNSGFWATPSQLYHHSRAVAGGGVGGSSSTTANLNNEDEEELVVDEQLTADDTDNINHNLELEGMEIPKEPLFEKPLTPSDVGKLNRLVIPKQHAEKYFPLSGGGDSGEKGFLLSFEDEMGKSWRFRYSYWNSSQSYVLTKGWSRFVKEKRLDAGDFVLFSRHRADAGRLFIGWRRRNSGVESGGSQPVGGGGGYTRVFYPAGNPYPSQQHQGSSSSSSSHPYQPDCLHAGSVLQNQTSTAAVTASGNSKRLRLFGVNLECQADESEPSTPTEGSPMSSQGQPHTHHHHHHHQNPYQQQYYSTIHSHMGQDINFSSGDHVYRQG